LKTRYSLTQRVIWALTGTVAVFVVLLCAVSYLTFAQMEDDLVNAVLTTEANRLTEQLNHAEPIPRQQSRSELGAMIQTWLLKEPGDKELLPGPLRSLKAGSYVLEPGGNKTWHVIVVNNPQGTLYLRYDATSHEERVDEFGLIILALGVLCIVLAFILSKWLAGLVVGPMLELTHRLSGWAPGSPDMAVGRDDELGRLVEAFNRVQNKVDESIAFERDFASNVSHEIRTPLAAMRSDSEMMLLDPALAPDAAQRCRHIMFRIDGIVDSLASVQSLSHRDPVHTQRVSVRQALDEAWLALEFQAGREDLSFVNEVSESFCLTLDRYALLMVMRNLIRNAIEHAAPASLVVSQLSADSIAFTDNGRGIAADALPFVFERYYRAGRADARRQAGVRQNSPAPPYPDVRRGLGLAIAKRVCDLHHWQLDVESTAQGDYTGTVFVLRF
jgi:signal transduction histidine kinase